MDTPPLTNEERTAKLLAHVAMMESGWGGMLKGGRLVDRREHPEASIVAANSMLRIGKPMHRWQCTKGHLTDSPGKPDVCRTCKETETALWLSKFTKVI